MKSAIRRRCWILPGVTLEFGGLRLKAGFLFAAYLTFLLHGGGGRAGLLFVCALAHELGHLAALRAFGVRRVTLSLQPGGAALGCAGLSLLPYKKALAAALAGPAANGALAAVCALLARGRAAPGLWECVRVNLALGLCNLLPLPFLDGGAALACAVGLRRGEPAGPSRAAEYGALLLMAGGCVWLAATGREAAPAVVFTVYCFLHSVLAKRKEIW